jgi:putative ubiquitin-RnfH superfamily antitoxin RatB of RatAB toxin-antitoxin module
MPTPTQAQRCAVQVVALAGGVAFCKNMLVPRQQTLAWAINASGVLAQYPQLRGAKVGVWGQILPPETVVMADDRIEIYTPILPEALKNHRANLRIRRQPT